VQALQILLSGFETYNKNLLCNDNENCTKLISKLRGESRGAIGAIAPLKPAKVTLFTMILCNSENSIHEIRPFCHPFSCHSNVVKYTSSLLQW